MYKVIIGFIGALLTTLQAWASWNLHYVEYEGRKVEYAYYVPKTVTAETDAIILVNGLNAKGEQMINDQWIALSDQTGRPIIAPTFPFEGHDAFQKRQSFQFPDAWSGDALNAIFNQFEEKGIHIERLYMAGFSAGAQFVGRYALAHPDQVVKCAIGASGSNDHIKKASPVKFFYAIGENDQWNRRMFATDFVKEANKYGISVEYKVYPNAGHRFTPEMKEDFVRFMQD